MPPTRNLTGSGLTASPRASSNGAPAGNGWRSFNHKLVTIPVNKPNNRLDRIRGHSLLPAAIKATLPQLYATEGQGWQAVAQVKYFTPDSNWTCAAWRRE